MTKIGEYEIGELIYSDKFFEMRLANHIPSGKEVMCKVIERKLLHDADAERRLKREIIVLSKLHHENIDRLIAFHKSKKHFFLFFEYSQTVPLMNLLNNGPLSELSARRYFQQLINVVDYIHSQNISHRDIKPDIIFITESNNIKITGFSISIIVTNSNTLLETVCGTPAYSLPEIFLKKPYNGFDADIWGSVVTLYYM